VPGSVGRPAYRLYQVAWAGLDWLYPPRCGGCGKRDSRWCSDCQINTQMIMDCICKRCGQTSAIEGICNRCQTSPPEYIAIRSWAVYNGSIRNAIQRLKYKGDIALGEILARPLIALLHTLKWEINLVVPVPTSIARHSQRGYNQAALLALPVALGSGITYRPQALIKIRETPSQVGRTVEQRRQNVAKAFKSQAKYVCGKNVLVVDDVTTSGATMEECAYALTKAGAQQVYGLTLARPAQNL
jgi:competence protein ComFC